MKKRLMSHQYLFGVVCIISLILLSVIYEKQPCQGFDPLTPAVAVDPPILYFFWGEGFRIAKKKKCFSTCCNKIIRSWKSASSKSGIILNLPN